MKERCPLCGDIGELENIEDGLDVCRDCAEGYYLSKAHCGYSSAVDWWCPECNMRAFECKHHLYIWLFA